VKLFLKRINSEKDSSARGIHIQLVSSNLIAPTAPELSVDADASIDAADTTRAISAMSMADTNKRQNLIITAPL